MTNSGLYGTGWMAQENNVLQYLTDVMFPQDDGLERSRRMEIYREQAASFEAARRDLRLCRGPYARAVRCVDLDQTFPTLRAAAAFMRTTRFHLRGAISKGRRCKGYRFEYASGPAVRVATGRERPVCCLNDGVVKSSLTEAARHGGVPASTLCEALREAKGRPAACGGRLWQYVTSKAAA